MKAYARTENWEEATVHFYVPVDDTHHLEIQTSPKGLFGIGPMMHDWSVPDEFLMDCVEVDIPEEVVAILIEAAGRIRETAARIFDVRDTAMSKLVGQLVA